MSSLISLLKTELIDKPLDDSYGSTKLSQQQLSDEISKLGTVSNEDLAKTLIFLSNFPTWDGSLLGNALKSSKNVTPISDWQSFYSNFSSEVDFESIHYKFNLTTSSFPDFLKTLVIFDKNSIIEFYQYNWAPPLDLAVCIGSFFVPHEKFSFKENGLSPILLPKIFNEAPLQIADRAAFLIDHPFNILPIVHAFLRAVANEKGQGLATSFLDQNGKSIPELFFFGALTMPKPTHSIIERVLDNLFELSLTKHIDGQVTFYALPFFDKPFLIKRLVDHYYKDPLAVNYIFEAAKIANIISDLLTLEHSTFTLEIASTADKLKIPGIDFPLFLKRKAQSGGPSFIAALLDFLELKASIEYASHQNPNNTPSGLDIRTVSAAIYFLCTAPIPPEKAELFKNIQFQCLQAYPRLINFGQGHDEAILSHQNSNSFSSAVEQEMKIHYQRMYEGQIEIRDIITMLQRLKQSKDPYEQDVFACMVHSLFDEYKFFPEYPLNALATTAVLFGSLIYFQLIDGLPLRIAFRFILQSLKRPVDSNMFKFGLQALFEFRERLPEFPKYCCSLLDVPGLQMHPQFYQQIKDIVGSTVNTVYMGDISNNSFLFTSINIDVGIPEEPVQEEPPETVKEAVMFLVNNLAPDTLKDKSKKLSSSLQVIHYRWFASYIVAQRAKQEPNFHSIYIDLLNILDAKLLDLYFTQVTYFEIAKLIRSPDTEESQDKRKFLRNLGLWLGSLTLQRNRPILHRNIAFKKLLCEAFDEHRLGSVVPFVCKVLTACSNSVVFAPPNPWLLGILKVLMELYQFADLKLNLKFEIEVLCKDLNIDMETIEPSFIIRNYLSQDLDLPSVNLSAEMQNMNINKETIPVNQGVTLPRNQLIPPSAVPASVPTSEDVAAILARQQEQQEQQQQQEQQLYEINLLYYLELASRLDPVSKTGITIHPAFKQMFAEALKRSITDSLAIIIDRSASIAVISTRALILKDFAMEPSEEKLRQSAHKMVSTFAGSHAVASSKDAIKESLTSNFRAQLLASRSYNESNIPMDKVNDAINENMDGVCAILQSASIDRAILQIDDLLKMDYAKRQEYAKSGSTQPFQDNVSSYNLHLPEPFRLRPGGLTPNQFAIYEAFGHFKPFADSSLQGAETDQRHNTALNASITSAKSVTNAQTLIPAASNYLPNGANSGTPAAAILAQTPGATRAADESTGALFNSVEMDPNAKILFESSLKQAEEFITSLYKIILDSPHSSFTEMEPNHSIFQDLSVILNFCETTAVSCDIFYDSVCNIIVTLLFTEPQTKFSSEILVLLLQNLTSKYPFVFKAVIDRVMLSENYERFSNVEVVAAFVKLRFFSWPYYDQYLGEAINKDKSGKVIKFATKLIEEAVLASSPLALRSDFAYSLESLKAFTSDPKIDADNDVKEDLKKSTSSLFKQLEQYEHFSIDDEDADKQVELIFAEWIHLVQRPGSKSSFHDSFVSQLAERGILADSDVITLLIRKGMEISKARYAEILTEKQILEQQSRTTNQPLPEPNASEYETVDSLAQLVACIFKSNFHLSESKQMSYAKLLLTVVAMMLCNDHESQDENLGQKVYFRFFFSLSCELSQMITENPSAGSIYLVLADIFLVLQPIGVPGFVFSWISLISGKYFMPQLLTIPEKKGWGPMVQLLNSLLRFQTVYAQGKEFPGYIASIYKGTLKLFIVLLNDFPDLTIEYHWVLTKNLAPSYVQLRNLILSTFPKNMELPDPLTQGLKVDRLPQIRSSPVVAIDPSIEMESLGLKDLVDEYLKSPNVAIARGIIKGLSLKEPVHESGLGFDIVTIDNSAMNALALYIVMDASKDSLDGDSTPQFSRDMPHLALISTLLLELTVEGQYFFCGAMANQLRYPNRHTHFYICVFLMLFGSYGTAIFDERKDEIRQVITRVLLERIMCNRPHPWGLTITFTELLKNNTYKFWELSFIKTHPDIERMFSSLFEHITKGNLTTESNGNSANPSSTPSQSSNSSNTTKTTETVANTISAAAAN